MNRKEIFVHKLDTVLDIMLHGKFRKDMDDTLLEKLLDILRDASNLDYKFVDRSEYLITLLEETKIQNFLKTAICSLQTGENELDCKILTFSLRLMSIFAENSSIFSYLNDVKLLEAFSAMLKNCTLSIYPPSVQTAFLFCIYSISKHAEGVKWLVQQGILNNLFIYCSSSGFYVRKEAVNTLTTIMITWTAIEAGITDKRNFSPLLIDFAKKLVGFLEESILNENTQASDCFISILHKAVIECELLRILFCEQLQLPVKLFDLLSMLKLNGKVPDKFFNLMAVSILSSCNECCLKAEKVINLLIQKKMLEQVILFYSLYLSSAQSSKDLINVKQLTYLMGPVVLFLELKMPDEHEETFLYLLKEKMVDKSSYCLFLRLFVIAASKLISLMDNETLPFVSSAVLKILKFMTSENSSSLHYDVSSNIKLQTSVLEFAQSLIDKKAYMKLTSDVKCLLMETLISLVDFPSSYDQVPNQALKLLREHISVESDSKAVFPAELKEKLLSVIHKRLFDVRSNVVDTALEVINKIVELHINDESWKQLLCNIGIHTAVWDIAVNSESEGFVKPTAIYVLNSLCFCPSVWNELKSERGAEKDKALNFLCKLANDPDPFVQRQSVSSLLRWTQIMGVLDLPKLEISQQIFKTFTLSVINSLDWDTKLIALHAWQTIAEKQFSDVMLKENIQNALQMLCSSGCGLSLLTALTDYNRSIQFEAAKILLRLREILIKHEINESSFKYIYSNNSTENKLLEQNINSYHCNGTNERKQVTKEEKERAINDVVDMDMFDRICNVLQPGIADLLQNEPGSSNSVLPENINLSCDFHNFWQNLWSDDVSCIFRYGDKPFDIYENNSVALLDDIVAAKLNVNIPAVKYQDIDCY